MSTSRDDVGRFRLGRIAVVLCLGLGTLAACGAPGGGTPPPTPTDCDGDFAGGPDANDTIATAVAPGTEFGDVRSCNDDTRTGDTADVDVFRLSTTGQPGRLTVTCPAGDSSGFVKLLDSSGTKIIQGLCNSTASTAFDIAVPAGTQYLEVDHFPGSVELTLPIDYTPLIGPETDPLAITLPQTISGTVGPADLTDTITFTDPVGQLFYHWACAIGVPLTVTGKFSGNTNSIPLTCGTSILGGAANLDDGQPVTVTVSAPVGATGPVGYVITFGS